MEGEEYGGEVRELSATQKEREYFPVAGFSLEDVKQQLPNSFLGEGKEQLI